MPAMGGVETWEVRQNIKVRWLDLVSLSRQHVAGDEPVGAVKSDGSGFESRLCHFVA